MPCVQNNTISVRLCVCDNFWIPHSIFRTDNFWKLFNTPKYFLDIPISIFREQFIKNPAGHQLVSIPAGENMKTQYKIIPFYTTYLSLLVC